MPASHRWRMRTILKRRPFFYIGSPVLSIYKQTIVR
jgi:hypothetical protein